MLSVRGWMCRSLCAGAEIRFAVRTGGPMRRAGRSKCLLMLGLGGIVVGQGCVGPGEMGRLFHREAALGQDNELVREDGRNRLRF